MAAAEVYTVKRNGLKTEPWGTPVVETTTGEH